MHERFLGLVLSINKEEHRIYVESLENSTSVLFNYERVDNVAEIDALDLTKNKYTVAIDFNGVMTMSIPGQANAQKIEVTETSELPSLSGTVTRYANGGFYLTTLDGDEVRIKSQEFVELNDSVSVTYDDTLVFEALSFEKHV